MNQVELIAFAKRARQRLVDNIKGFGKVNIPVYDSSNEVWYQVMVITDDGVEIVMTEDVETFISGNYDENDFVSSFEDFDTLTFNELYDIALGVALLEEE